MAFFTWRKCISILFKDGENTRWCFEKLLIHSLGTIWALHDPKPLLITGHHCHFSQQIRSNDIFSSTCCLLYLPEKFIEISVFHVLKDHDERVSIHTHSIELYYMLVLEVGQQFSLTLEIFPGCKSGILQSLGKEREIQRDKEIKTVVKHWYDAHMTVYRSFPGLFWLWTACDMSCRFMTHGHIALLWRTSLLSHL